MTSVDTLGIRNTGSVEVTFNKNMFSQNLPNDIITTAGFQLAFRQTGKEKTEREGNPSYFDSTLFVADVLDDVDVRRPRVELLMPVGDC